MFDLIRQFPNEIEAYQSRPNPALLMNSKLVARTYVHPLGLCHGSTILAQSDLVRPDVYLCTTCSGMTRNQLFSTFDTLQICQDATSLSSPFSSSLSSSLPVPSPSESPSLFFSLF